MLKGKNMKKISSLQLEFKELKKKHKESKNKYKGKLGFSERFKGFIDSRGNSPALQKQMENGQKTKRLF